MIEFVAAGGPTLVGDAQPRLARKARDHLGSAQTSFPAASGLLASPCVAYVPADRPAESSKALRLAVALGAAAITVCAMTPDRAWAGPQAPGAAPAVATQVAPVQVASLPTASTQAARPAPSTSPSAPAVDLSIAARAHSQAIMASFSPMTQSMARELHPDLLEVAALARKESGLEFEIVPGTGGHRTLEMQRQLVARGASKTMTSRHMSGLAMDLVPMHRFGNLSAPNFFDKTGYMRIDAAMRQAAKELGVPFTTGLDFHAFPDLGHFELEKHAYANYVPGQPIVSRVTHIAPFLEAAPAAPQRLHDDAADLRPALHDEERGQTAMIAQP